MSDVETRGTFVVLGDVMRDIRAAEDVLREEQHDAWRRYIQRVDAILAFDLEIEDDPDDDHDPSHVLASLRALVGELRVQTRLGAMEGEELVNRVRAALRRISS